MDFIAIRKSRGFTQQSLSEAIGVKQTTVAMWESGRSVPHMKNVVALSSVLGVCAEELYVSFRKYQQWTKE